MGTEQMRQEFEAWWRKEMNVEVMDLHRCNFPMQPANFVQPYACHETQRAWLAWQASRAAVVVELPEDRIARGYGEQVADALGFNDGVGYCRAAIEATGLKVKP